VAISRPSEQEWGSEKDSGTGDKEEGPDRTNALDRAAEGFTGA
jgi:hypothetical protein